MSSIGADRVQEDVRFAARNPLQRAKSRQRAPGTEIAVPLKRGGNRAFSLSFRRIFQTVSSAFRSPEVIPPTRKTTMKHLYRPSIISLCVGLCSLLGFSAESREQIDLDFQNRAFERVVAERSIDQRPSVSRPAAGTLPTPLTITAPSAASAATDTSADEAQPALETRAAVAATWTARQQIDLFARRELYQAGFYDALQTTINDPELGRWDYQQGLHAGRRDPATAVGSEIGYTEATKVARSRARAHVTAQWELGHDRELDPRPTAATLEVSVPDITTPQLFDVFDDFPLASVLEQTDTQGLKSLWTLYHHDSYDDFYDNAWADAEHAFDYWLSHHRDRAAWIGLDAPERSQFEQLFRRAYAHQIVELIADIGNEAYSQGHDHGWDYGSFVAYEWNYRQGYHQGFEIAVHEHARTAFREAYPRLYREKVDELFRQHSQSARLEISPLRTRDNQSQGVLEP